MEFYNGAAQFHATSMIAVVFGQFSVLMLLEGRVHWSTTCLTWAGLYSLRTGAIAILTIAYALILAVGWYSVYMYMIFADLIERLKNKSSLRALKVLDDGMRDETGENRSVINGRAWLIRQRVLVSAIYLIVSFLCLLLVPSL